MRVHNASNKKNKKDDTPQETIVNLTTELPQTSAPQFVQTSDFTHFTLNTTGNQPTVTQIEPINNGTRNESPQQHQAQTIVTVPISFTEGTQFVAITTPNSRVNVEK